MADAVQIKLKLENAQLAKDLRKSERDFARLEAQAKKSTSNISSAFVGMAKGIASAFISFEAVKGFANAVIATSKAVADLNDQAQQVGIGFKAFQELQYTAIQSGTSIEKLTASIAKMQVSLGKMAETGKDDVLGQLGLSIEKIINLSPDKQFSAIVEGLSNIENPAQRAAAAAELFGKGFRELNPLIAQGADGLDAYAQQANRLGVVISDVTRDEMAKFDDAMETLKLQLQASRAEGFAPLVAYINGEFAEATENGTNNTNLLTEALTRVSALAIGTAETFRNWDWGDPSTWGVLTKTLENSSAALDKIKAQAKIDWSNFIPPPLADFVASDTTTTTKKSSGVDRAAQLAKQAKDDAETYAKNFAEALSSSQFKTFEAGVDLASIGAENIDQIKLAVSLTKELADLQSGAFTKDHLANLEAEAIARYEINTAIIAGTEAIEKQQAAQEKSAKLLEALGTIAEAEAQRTQEMAEAISEPLIRAMDGVITGAISAQDAVKDLIRQLLIAVAQAALLAAFGQGSFGSNFSNIITGNRSATPQGGPTLRILNQSGGLVTTRRRSNGDTDLIIGQLAKAISTGGNQLDKAIRRTYGIGRQGV